MYSKYVLKFMKPWNAPKLHRQACHASIRAEVSSKLFFFFQEEIESQFDFLKPDKLSPYRIPFSRSKYKKISIVPMIKAILRIRGISS